ncbi:MAG: hypothetical protein KDG55_02850 [Rhodocyclaceae bacterium]|nr:hypothetical protein [Rhodocyclaceae bacterium]
MGLWNGYAVPAAAPDRRARTTQRRRLATPPTRSLPVVRTGAFSHDLGGHLGIHIDVDGESGQYACGSLGRLTLTWARDPDGCSLAVTEAADRRVESTTNALGMTLPATPSRKRCPTTA